MRIERSGGGLSRVLALVCGFGRHERAGDGTGSMRVGSVPSSADWPDNDDDPPFGAVPSCADPWPADPHEVPEWMAKSIAWHEANGMRPLCYRTRAEFDALVARLNAAEELDEIISRSAPKPKLSPEDAAIDFVGALRAAERTGQYLSDELSAAYLEHCAATNRRPTAENRLRKALKAIPGVRDEKINIEGPRRYRPTVWIIEPLDTVENIAPLAQDQLAMAA